MKTALLEDVKRDSTQLDDLVTSSDSTHLVRDGKVVAVITPIPAQPISTTMKWPDFASQRRAVFGDAICTAGVVQSLMDEDRQEAT